MVMQSKLSSRRAKPDWASPEFSKRVAPGNRLEESNSIITQHGPGPSGQFLLHCFDELGRYPGAFVIALNPIILEAADDSPRLEVRDVEPPDIYPGRLSFRGLGLDKRNGGFVAGRRRVQDVAGTPASSGSMSLGSSSYRRKARTSPGAESKD